MTVKNLNTNAKLAQMNIGNRANLSYGVNMLQNVNIFVIIWARNMACSKQRAGRMNLLIALMIGGMLFFTAILIAVVFLNERK